MLFICFSDVETKTSPHIVTRQDALISELMENNGYYRRRLLFMETKSNEPTLVQLNQMAVEDLMDSLETMATALNPNSGEVFTIEFLDAVEHIIQLIRTRFGLETSEGQIADVRDRFASIVASILTRKRLLAITEEAKQAFMQSIFDFVNVCF